MNDTYDNRLKENTDVLRTLLVAVGSLDDRVAAEKRSRTRQVGGLFLLGVLIVVAVVALIVVWHDRERQACETTNRTRIETRQAFDQVFALAEAGASNPHNTDGQNQVRALREESKKQLEQNLPTIDCP